MDKKLTPNIRYRSLDAMRGIAAIMVAIMHYDAVEAGSGYLAVDFFFVLSGFVISKAFTEKLYGGMTLSSFAALRIVRLYPMYALGIIFGFAYALQNTLRLADFHMTKMQLISSALLGIFMLPDPLTPEMFQVNGVSWSLFFEFIVNIIFAAALFRLPRRALVTLIAFSAAMLFCLIKPPAFASGGGRWDGIGVGASRTLFSFSLGLLIARIETNPFQKRTHLFLLLPLMLFLFLFITPPREFRAAYDLIFIFTASPLLLILGATWEPPSIYRRICSFLGDISYPLYAVHVPLAHSFQYASRHFHVSMPALVVPFMLVSLALAAITGKFWDAPAREWLKTRLTKQMTFTQGA